MSHQTTILVLILFACLSYGVQTSLYFPGLDSQPMSADFVSTDSEGHTVWAVHLTQDAGGGFGFPVMTLTEGSSYASIGHAFTQGTTINEACGSDGAICTATVNGPVATGTVDGALTGTATAVSQGLGTTPPESAEAISGTIVPTSFPSSAKSALGSVSSTGSVTSSRTTASATSSPVTNSNSASLGKSTIGLKACLSLVAFFSLYVAL